MTGLFHCHFFSQVLGFACNMDVILPQPALPGRRQRTVSRRKYPCLYLLHGLSDDHSIWQRRTSIERYVTDLNLVVVMPSVHRSFYADMEAGYRYWTFISEELPALCRAWFPISAAREDTFAAGLSMGGYGAFKLALTHPDRYAAAASLSGALDIASSAKDPGLATDTRLIYGEPSSVSGSRNDLLRLAHKVARSRGPKPRLFQCCGTEDFLYADNSRFRKHAVKLGLDLTYVEGPGAHEWGYWDQHIQHVLAWLPLKGRRSKRP